jgi:hypothetical protein
MKDTGYHMILIDNMADIFCNFVKIDNIYECSKCGNRVSFNDGNEPPLFPCRSPLKKDIKDVPAAIRSIIPNSSLELIEQRYSLCLSCEFLKNNTCTKCGCNITRDRNYMNKLASESESCPIAKW